MAWWILPTKANVTSVAGPAAALGLFVVAIALPRLTRKPLEVACLTPFTFMSVAGRRVRSAMRAPYPRLALLHVPLLSRLIL